MGDNKIGALLYGQNRSKVVKLNLADLKNETTVLKVVFKYRLGVQEQVCEDIVDLN